MKALAQSLAVGIALLLSLNLSSPVQGSPIPDVPSTTMLTRDVEARIQEVLDLLPESTVREWRNQTGQDLRDAIDLAPRMVAKVHDRLASNPPSTPQEAADLLMVIARDAAMELLGIDPATVASVGVPSSNCWAMLGPEVNQALAIACQVVAAALFPVVLVVAVVVLVALVVLVVALIALSVAMPVLQSVIELLISATPIIPATCPPECPPPPAREPGSLHRRLGQMEYVLNGTAPADPHDVDHDGVSDAWDAVNLRSEAQAVTLWGDALDVLDGLPNLGFVLLVNSGFREAWLVAADPFEPVRQTLAPTVALDAEAALDRIEALQGRELRNALASVLPEGTEVHYTPVAAEVATNVPLLWNDELPADGTWLLLVTDPTRGLDVQLAGQTAPIASRALSQFSSDKTDHRWTFINLHTDDSFCYDPTTRLPNSPCQGAEAPGWLRAFSGAAANALTALQEGLEAGTVPVSTTPPTPVELAASQAALLDAPAPVSDIHRGDDGCVYYDGNGNDVNDNETLGCHPALAFDPSNLHQGDDGCFYYDINGNGVNDYDELILTCPSDWTSASSSRRFEIPASTLSGDSEWELVGNESRSMPVGLGIDYLIAGKKSMSLVEQVTADSLDGPVQLSEPRLFSFQAIYHSTPAAPRNLTHVQLRVEDLDGNGDPQAFLIDGRALAELLELQSGDEYRLAVDDEHKAGFDSIVRDVNQDTIPDLLVYVPHFSQAWIDVTNSNTQVHFQNVAMTGPTTAWLTGASNTVYHYSSGTLQAYPIPGLSGSHLTYGLYVESDTEFWVAAACAGSEVRSRVVHYKSTSLAQGAFVDTTYLPNCSYASRLWISSGGAVGYAVADGAMYKLQDGSWSRLVTPATCAIVAMDLDANGQGLIGTTAEDGTPPCGGGVYYFDGAIFSARTTASNAGFWRFESSSGTWAAGRGQALHEGGSGWAVSTGAPSGSDLLAVAQAGGSDDHWFVGTASSGGALVAKASGSNSWTTNPLDHSVPSLTDVDLFDDRNGLAVGFYGSLVKFKPYIPPLVFGTISQTTGTTETTFFVDGSGTQAEDSAQFWDWHDNAIGTGRTSSHRYNTPGTYQVDHIISEQGYWKTYQSWTVTVTASTLTLGSPLSGTFAPMPQDKVTTAPERAFHYKLTGTGGYVMTQLTQTGPLAPHYYMTGKFATGGTAGIDGTGTPWPNPDAVLSLASGTSRIGGYLANGQVLDVEVRSWLYEDANIKNVDGSRSNSWGDVGYTLLASVAQPPLAPTTTQTSGTTLPLVQFTATGPHQNVNEDTRLEVVWGDNTTQADIFRPQGQQVTFSHTYAPGSYTLTLNNWDRASQVRTTTVSLVVHALPTASTTSATMGSNTGTLLGSITNFGGASSATGKYELYLGSTLVQSSSTYSLSSPGSLPAWAVSGLTSGRSYTYRVVATNDVGTSETAKASAATLAALTLVPQVQSNPMVNLGSASTLGLKASASSARPVAYYVTWDVGSQEIRYPSTGYVAWDQVVTASKTLPFAGTHAAQIRLENDLAARGPATNANVVVQGNGAVTNLASSSTATTATLSATVANLGVSPVKFRFGLYDPSTATWTYTSWVDAATGSAQSWSPSVNIAKTYSASVFLYDAADNEAWQSGPVTVRLNQAPTLQAVALPARVNHLDGIRFAVTYTDPEGDAPRSSSGALQNPLLTVNGTTYTMHFDSGTPATGASYYYIVPASKLLQGLSVVPSYAAWDQYQRTASAAGAALYVAKEAHTYFDFEDQHPGAPPNGFNVWGSPGYWHIQDSAVGLPQRVTMGRHGNVAWFGNSETGNYETSGHAWGGLSTSVLDLRLAVDPVLSYSSFYETQDLGFTNDVKRVYIQYRNPWESTWSNPVLLQSVGGYEGGYGAWRTQHVDLSGYEGKLVKLYFYFEANDDDNRHIGWMIDDIVVGYDQDGDQLPDRLEKMRRDVQVTTNPVTVQVPDAGQARGYVRRLDRPMASSLALDAVVSSPAPNQLKITVGARDTQAGTEVTKVIHDGTPTGNCGAAPPGFVGPVASGASSVDVRSDGVVIHLNAKSCGLNIPERADWFLEVKDKRSGDALTYIDSLRAVASGQTSVQKPDSDADDASDGVEVNLLQDPLGSDSDRDGIPARVDPDEAMPSWAPALKVESTDFSRGVTVDLQDPLAPIVAIGVQGQFNATGQTSDFSLTSRKDGTWRAMNPEAASPDALLVNWQDAYGTTGTAKVFMQSDGSGYGPSSVEWLAVDAATGHPVKMKRSLADAAGPSQVRSVGFAGAFFNTVATGTRLALATPELTATALRSASVVVGAVFAGVELLIPRTGDFDPATQQKWSQAWADGTSITYTDQLLNSLAVRGLTATEIRDALNNQDGSDFVVRNPGDWTRVIRSVGGTLVVLTIVEKDGVRVLRDAWKWQLPSIVDWGEPLPIAFWTMVEVDILQRLGESMQDALEHSPFARKAKPEAVGDPLSFIAVVDSGDGMNGDTFPEGGVMAWDEGLRVYKVVYDAFDVNEVDPNRAADKVVGKLSMDYLQFQAESNRLFSTRDEGYWYWDNDSTKKDCQVAASAIPDVRRCTTPKIPDNADGGSISSTNPFVSVDVVKMRWPDRTPPVGQPNAYLFEDALVSLGRTWGNQPVSYAIPPGQTVADSALPAVKAAMDANDLSAYNAGAAVGYEFMEDLGGQIDVYYKET